MEMPVLFQHGYAAQQRVGDAERSATCDALSAHFAAGRLRPDELDQRLSLAMAAVTREDLWRLTADLPGSPPPVRREQQASWPVPSVLAGVALVGSTLLAGVMLLVLGAVQPLLFIAAAFGGAAAVTGGASATYLIMRHLQVRRSR